MKLIKRTYYHTAIWLIPFVVIGSMFSFFIIEYIAYEEIDEFLEYEMERLVEYHRLNNDLPAFNNVAGILEDVRYDAPFYKDTLLLETGDNEMVPFRELWFSIRHDGRDFTIVLRHLLLGRDDIIEGTLLIISGLMLLIAMFMFITLNQVSGKIWAPFYKTLDKLALFNLRNPSPVFEQTKIDEFNTLNRTLQGLLKKISDDYRHNKEFNENASHELQTHLAVIKANAGKLLDSQKNEPGESEEAAKIYSAATHLSRVQKSLLLLSRINNREFSNLVMVDLAGVLNNTFETFAEAIEIREISLTRNISACTVSMDAGLAEILVNNLVKNAVKHNVEKGFLDVMIGPGRLIISNSGLAYGGNPQSLLHRFSKGSEGNTGIGLAIVKEICDLYGFSLDYSINNTVHQIAIGFRQS